MTSGDALTGRDNELAALRRALGGAGNYAGVVIAGPAGVGKTRLARELVGVAAGNGTRTKWVSANRVGAANSVGRLAITLSDAATEAALQRAPGDQCLVAQRQGRTLIGVDDAHLLDGFSARGAPAGADPGGPAGGDGPHRHRGA